MGPNSLIVVYVDPRDPSTLQVVQPPMPMAEFSSWADYERVEATLTIVANMLRRAGLAALL